MFQTHQFVVGGNQTLMIQGYGTSAASSTSYGYDAAGNQTMEIVGFGSADQEETSYGYNADGNQITQIAGYGSSQPESTQSQYDNDGNLTKQTDPDGNVSSFAYDFLGDQTLAILGLNTPQQASSTDSYDKDGNLTQSTDADGHVTQYHYDSVGDMTLSIDGDGDSTSYHYDGDGNDVLTIVGFGTLAAESTLYAYDGNGNQTLQTVGYNSSHPESTQSNYDGDGNLTQQIDPDGYTSTFAFDSVGDQTLSTLGSSDTSDTYDHDGNVTLSVDPDGNSTSYQYDAVGNMTLEIQAAGTSAATQTSYGYDAAGNQTMLVDGYGGSNPESTSYVYDADGNETQTIAGYGSSHAETTLSKYDDDNNLTQQIDPDGHTSTYAYDSLGDQIQSVIGAGSSNPNATNDSYDGDGNLTLSVNAVGDSTSYSFDGDNNEISVISGLNTPSAATVAYAYDAAGNEVAETDPDGNVTSYGYDGAGDQTLMIQAAGSSAPATTSYQYDGDGNVTSQSNPNGSSIQSSYNDLGEVVSQEWTGPGSASNSLDYTYDADGNMLTASNNAGTESFAYNADGEQTLAVAPSGVSLNYSYDADGNVVQITDSLGDTVSSQYDADGNLIQRSATGPNGAQIEEDLSYDGDNNLTSVTRKGQVSGQLQTVGSSTYAYDSQGDVTSIVHANASGSTLDSFSYSYDAAGQVTQEVDYNTGTTNYSYDATGQLTAAGPVNYSYDANGNPKNSGDSVGPNNELSSDGTWNYSYDANGNNTGKVGVSGGPDAGLSWTYSYDASNELISATETNSQSQTLVQASYTYDDFSNLISSSVSLNGGTAVVTHYVYDGSTLWATLTASNAVQTLYVSGDQPDQFLAQIDASNGVGWYLTDHLDSVRDLMNNSSVVTDAIAYSAYGQVVSQSNPSQAPVVGWDGYQTFAALDMDQAGQRIYDPEMERWMQQDPSGLGADSNTYRYVQNDPTNMVDPSGEEGQWAQGWMDRLWEVDPMVYQYLQDEQPWNIAETSGGFLGKENWKKEDYVKDGVLHLYIGQNYTQEDALAYISRVVREQPGFKAFDTQANRAAVRDEAEREKAYQLAVSMTPSRPFNAVQNARDLADLQPEWTPEEVFVQTLADRQAALDPDRAAALERAADAADSRNWSKAWQAWLNSGTTFNDFLDLPWKVMQTNEFQQGVRIAGAGLEAVSGVLMIVNPFVPVGSQALGMIMIGHAFDTAFASGASVAAGKNVQTYTQQLSTEAALKLGASEETANRIGVVADNMPGLLAVAHDGVQLASLAKNWWQEARSAGSVQLIKGKPTQVRYKVLTREQAEALGGCFLPGTLIATEEGLKPIETVRALEKVWAYDLRTGTWKLCYVSETFRFVYGGELVAVTVAGHVIRGTSGHPYWVVEGRDLASRPRAEHIPEVEPYCRTPGRWVDAGDLQVGDVLLLRDGRRAAVTQLHRWQDRLEVYNLRVEGLQCYAVGANGVLVHNNSAAQPPAPARTPMEWKIPINEGGAINAVGKTGNIEIEVIGNMSRSGNTITLDGVHFTKNTGGTLGPKQLQEFGRDFLRQHGNGATELVINPAPRTTGAAAGTGVAPKPITIKLE